jgi:mediator of RNA polymerase II transcription subunit 21
MADRLTQLQDCFDQLLTQMYATIRYIDTHHASVSIPGQADQFTPMAETQGSNATGSSATPAPTGSSQDEPSPDPPALFQKRMRELAQDLVLKEQQIEALVHALPGIGNSQALQERRLASLEKQLKEVEEERQKWGEEKERLLSAVDGWLAGVRRV